MPQLELGNQGAQLVGLSGEFFGGGGGFLGRGGVLLRHLVDLAQTLADLGDALCLFVGGGGHFADQVAHLDDAADDFGQGFGGFLGHAVSFVHATPGALDEVGRFARGLGAARRQAAHFFGHNRKPLAVPSGACGFHSRVQRQNVGLKGNVVDGFDDLGNLSAGLGDGRHRGVQSLHAMRSRLRRFLGDRGQLVGLGGRLGVVLGLVADFRGRGTDLLQTCRRFGCALAQGLGGVCNLAGAAADLVDSRLHLREGVVHFFGQRTQGNAKAVAVGENVDTDREISGSHFAGDLLLVRKALLHPAEGVGQAADFIHGFVGQIHIGVAQGNLLRRARHLHDGPHDALDQNELNETSNQQDRQSDPSAHDAHPAGGTRDLVVIGRDDDNPSQIAAGVQSGNAIHSLIGVAGDAFSLHDRVTKGQRVDVEFQDIFGLGVGQDQAFPVDKVAVALLADSNGLHPCGGKTLQSHLACQDADHLVAFVPNGKGYNEDDLAI